MKLDSSVPVAARLHCILVFVPLLLSGASSLAWPQAASAPLPESTAQKIERLTAAVVAAQEQMEAYRAQLLDLRHQLEDLEATANPALPAPAPAIAESSSAAGLGEIRERIAIHDSQIAAQDTTKIETQSKYPLTVSGLLLFTGYVNTRQVDSSVAPAYASDGPGSTGLSLRQSILGLDARGPHLLGAASYADLRVDFFASAAQSSYASAGILRLRTAHASLAWPNSDAFIELDRPLISPHEPTSLVAIAQPELAWAGSLWNWSPQIGASHRFALSENTRLETEAALIDASDPQAPGSSSASSSLTQAERSRWPGTEARIAVQRGASAGGFQFGAGGYFSPHRTAYSARYDAWAGTLDLRLPITRRFELTANAYRGQALAGLGAGGYVDYFYGSKYGYPVLRALDDTGGWAQLKARPSLRFELNSGYGIDNPFAEEVHAALSSLPAYNGLARNRAFYSNVIYSPSAYLLFSLEYKRLWTSNSSGPPSFSDSIGIAAGYKF